jgi:hypothetical protein
MRELGIMPGAAQPQDAQTQNETEDQPQEDSQDISPQMQAEDGFIPPRGAREEAKRGLAWRREYGRGGTAVGIARARDIAAGKSLPADTIMRMVSFFARHEVDKQGKGWRPGSEGFPSNGRIAWALWGGDEGRSFANKIARKLQKTR